MKRTVRIAMGTCALFLFVGCGEEPQVEVESVKITEAPASLEPPLVELDAEISEPVEEPSPESMDSEVTETHPLLDEPLVPREFDFQVSDENPLVIDLPESAVIEVDAYQTIFNFGDNFMDLGILDEEQDFDAIKQKAKQSSSFVEILTDEPNRLVIAREEFGKPNYKYYIKKKCGNTTYTVTPMSWQPLTKPTLEWAMKLADTLRLPSEG